MKSTARAESNVKDRILDTAEALFGQHGFDGVSLRQIGAAAAQGNNSVVQYHFGDKAGLVREIIERRIAEFEPWRCEKLESTLRGKGAPDVKSLLEILFLPVAECVDAQGQHAYARLMLQLLLQLRRYESIPHPGWSEKSAASKAHSLLREKTPFLTEAAFFRRYSYVSGMFLTSLVERDNAVATGLRLEPEVHFLRELFAMMDAALTMPVAS